MYGHGILRSRAAISSIESARGVIFVGMQACELPSRHGGEEITMPGSRFRIPNVGSHQKISASQGQGRTTEKKVAASSDQLPNNVAGLVKTYAPTAKAKIAAPFRPPAGRTTAQRNEAQPELPP